MDAAADRVLDRENPMRRRAARDRAKNVLETRMRQHIGRRLKLQPGSFAVGPRLALIGNAHSALSCTNRSAANPSQETTAFGMNPVATGRAGARTESRN